ncbi:hypothetical protein BUE80_DR001172 [Diplocarpon rosae]|nr:hypothetical protein BUE80_DR001172 [Diplocarpon rosae]
MGVPFEALIPYGIMLAMFGITGAGMSKIRHMQNGGKRGRHSVDQWDRVRRISLMIPGVSKANSAAAKYLARANTTSLAALIGCSDGSRPQTDWVSERADRQPGSASRIRVEQPLETREKDQIGCGAEHQNCTYMRAEWIVTKISVSIRRGDVDAMHNGHQ